MIGLKRGPLRALEQLLNKPLEFNAQSFVSRTPGWLEGRASEEHVPIEKLLSFYDQWRQSLIQEASTLFYDLPIYSVILAPSDAKTWAEFLTVDNSATERSLLSGAESVQTQLDRIADRLSHASSGTKKIVTHQKLRELVLFYLLSEALFLVFAGLARVELRGETIRILPVQGIGEQYLRRKWFANIWEDQSRRSTLAILSAFPARLLEDNESGKTLTLLGQGIRDKLFHIPVKELPPGLASSPTIRWTSTLCNLLALLTWAVLKEVRISREHPVLPNLGVDSTFLDELHSLMEARPPTDRIIHLKNGELSLARLGWVLQARLLADDLAKRRSEPQLPNLIGEFFEKHYVRMWIENLAKENGDYALLPGILAHEINKDNRGGDIDFILHDRRRNRYLFCQVKYVRSGGLPYLWGDVKHLIAGNISDGIRQLSEMKSFLAEGVLRPALAKRGIVDICLDNADWLLIHTITNLDFQQTEEGIALYEWNSLRNLLDRGRTLNGNLNGEPTDWRFEEVLPIETPDMVIGAFLEKHPHVKKHIGPALAESRSSTSVFNVGNQRLELEGLGL